MTIDVFTLCVSVIVNTVILFISQYLQNENIIELFENGNKNTSNFVKNSCNNLKKYVDDIINT